jgi:hypothetical protein
MAEDELVGRVTAGETAALQARRCEATRTLREVLASYARS